MGMAAMAKFKEPPLHEHLHGFQLTTFGKLCSQRNGYLSRRCYMEVMEYAGGPARPSVHVPFSMTPA